MMQLADVKSYNFSDNTDFDTVMNRLGGKENVRII